MTDVHEYKDYIVELQTMLKESKSEIAELQNTVASTKRIIFSQFDLLDQILEPDKPNLEIVLTNHQRIESLRELMKDYAQTDDRIMLLRRVNQLLNDKCLT